MPPWHTDIAFSGDQEDGWIARAILDLVVWGEGKDTCRLALALGVSIFHIGDGQRPGGAADPHQI
jgi:hypothetical protein